MWSPVLATSASQPDKQGPRKAPSRTARARMQGSSSGSVAFRVSPTAGTRARLGTTAWELSSRPTWPAPVGVAGVGRSTHAIAKAASSKQLGREQE